MTSKVQERDWNADVETIGSKLRETTGSTWLTLSSYLSTAKVLVCGCVFTHTEREGEREREREREREKIVCKQPSAADDTLVNRMS